MKQGQDISAEFTGLFLIHQRIKGSEIIEHSHDDHEIFFPLMGEIQVKTKTQSLKAGPGKMLYVPPRLDHTFTSSKSAEGERLIAIVSDKLWKKAGGKAGPPGVISTSQLAKEILFYLLLHTKSKATQSLIQTFVETVQEMLATPTLEGETDIVHLSGKTKDLRLKKAVQSLSDQFAENISMETLANEAGLSVRNFNRLFLVDFGLTPKQVLILRRVNEAKKLLLQRKSVTDVALEVGYSSLSQFIVTFRKVTGQLPSEFR